MRWMVWAVLVIPVAAAGTQWEPELRDEPGDAAYAVPASGTGDIVAFWVDDAQRAGVFSLQTTGSSLLRSDPSWIGRFEAVVTWRVDDPLSSMHEPFYQGAYIESFQGYGYVLASGSERPRPEDRADVLGGQLQRGVPARFDWNSLLAPFALYTFYGLDEGMVLSDFEVTTYWQASRCCGPPEDSTPRIRLDAAEGSTPYVVRVLHQAVVEVGDVPVAPGTPDVAAPGLKAWTIAESDAAVVVIAMPSMRECERVYFDVSGSVDGTPGLIRGLPVSIGERVRAVAWLDDGNTMGVEGGFALYEGGRDMEVKVDPLGALRLRFLASSTIEDLNVSAVCNGIRLEAGQDAPSLAVPMLSLALLAAARRR